MISVEDIEYAMIQVKSEADYPALYQNLKNLGVSHYSHFVESGNNIYYGKGGGQLDVDRNLTPVLVSETASIDKLRSSLSSHQQGQIDYPTFCVEAGAAGVEKWVTDLDKNTLSYLSRDGNEMLVVKIRPVE